MHDTPSEQAAAHRGIVELQHNVDDSPYYSHDMAPVPSAERRWSMLDLAVLWISMSACVPTYMLASGLIEQGMNWWQAVLTIFLANVIVLIPMVLNAHAGTKYGIPFPVYCRASFGILGANVPALLRALVACGWFGIQTWIGGEAIYKIATVFLPAWDSLPPLPLVGINAAQLACFLVFWLVNLLVVVAGIESIRILLNIKAPLLIALGLMLLAWAYYQANGFGNMLAKPSEFSAGGPKAGEFWPFFFAALTANVGFWATLSLNIPDFSRFAHSQRDQVWGQALGLPTTMALFSFIGVAVTSATVVIYGSAIWNPVELLSKFSNPIVLIVAMASLGVATLATNIAANVVSPANDFANLWPRYISFRIGGLITGIVGIAMQPWRLVEDPDGYIFRWLVAYSSLLGAIGGILIADYFILRRTRLNLEGLYRREGPYWYFRGFNPFALVALAVGIAPCVPGFLAAVSDRWQAVVPPFWIQLYHYAWFVSFGLSLLTYLSLTTRTQNDPFRSLLPITTFALIGCTATVILCYYFVDRPVAYFVHQHNFARFDVLKWLTYPPPEMQTWSPLVLATLVFRRTWGPWRSWQLALFVACISLIVADQFRSSLGGLFGRYWPETWHDNNPSLIGTGTYGFHPFQSGDDTGSFPSGHASRICAFFSVLWLTLPRRRWLYCLLSLPMLVALVGMNYHFVSDVVAGCVLGVLVGAYAVSLLQFFAPPLPTQHAEPARIAEPTRRRQATP